MSDQSSAPTTITQDDINAYARVSNDFNPIHVDPEFAKTTPYGSTIAHGTISSALVSNYLMEQFGGDYVVKRLSLKFIAPIRSGDRLKCIAEPVDNEGIADRSFKVSTANQDGASVAVGEAVVGRLV